MVPTTTGIMSAFNFHSCSILFANLGACLSFLALSRWYSCFLLWPCQWLSNFLLFSISTRSGRLCSITFPGWIGKSHKILHFLLTLTVYFSKLCWAAVVLFRASWLFVLYFARLHFSSLSFSPLNLPDPFLHPLGRGPFISWWFL